MEQGVQEQITLAADDVDKLFAGQPSAPFKGDRAGFNYNKLQAVICILASALVSISVIAWLVLK